jgi:hypothetical protein
MNCAFNAQICPKFGRFERENAQFISGQLLSHINARQPAQGPPGKLCAIQCTLSPRIPQSARFIPLPKMLK